MRVSRLIGIKKPVVIIWLFFVYKSLTCFSLSGHITRYSGGPQEAGSWDSWILRPEHDVCCSRRRRAQRWRMPHTIRGYVFIPCCYNLYCASLPVGMQSWSFLVTSLLDLCTFRPFCVTERSYPLSRHIVFVSCIYFSFLLGNQGVAFLSSPRAKILP